MKIPASILLVISIIVGLWCFIDLVQINLTKDILARHAASRYEIVILALCTLHILYIIVITGYLIRGASTIDPDLFLLAMIPFLSPGIILGIPFAIWGRLASGSDRGPEEKFR